MSSDIFNELAFSLSREIEAIKKPRLLSTNISQLKKQIILLEQLIVLVEKHWYRFPQDKRELLADLVYETINYKSSWFDQLIYGIRLLFSNIDSVNYDQYHNACKRLINALLTVIESEDIKEKKPLAEAIEVSFTELSNN